jgi:hypothetical protein
VSLESNKEQLLLPSETELLQYLLYLQLAVQSPQFESCRLTKPSKQQLELIFNGYGENTILDLQRPLIGIEQVAGLENNAILGGIIVLGCFDKNTKCLPPVRNLNSPPFARFNVRSSRDLLLALARRKEINNDELSLVIREDHTRAIINMCTYTHGLANLGLTEHDLGIVMQSVLGGNSKTKSGLTAPYCDSLKRENQNIPDKVVIIKQTNKPDELPFGTIVIVEATIGTDGKRQFPPNITTLVFKIQDNQVVVERQFSTHDPMPIVPIDVSKELSQKDINWHTQADIINLRSLFRPSIIKRKKTALHKLSKRPRINTISQSIRVLVPELSLI